MNNKQNILDQLNQSRMVKLSKVVEPKLECSASIKVAVRGSEHFYEYLSIFTCEVSGERYCVNHNGSAPKGSHIVNEVSLFGKAKSTKISMNQAWALQYAIKNYDLLREVTDQVQAYSYIVGYCAGDGIDVISLGLIG